MKSDWILIILSIIVGIVLTLIVVFSGIELNRRYKEKDCMKNKIEIGEYVRTKNGVIDKVDALYGMIENTVHLENLKWFDIKNIAKHSKQLIDLIEVGDIVKDKYNKYEVAFVKDDKIYCNDYNLDDSLITLREQDIKAILTKEQFAANCYKVGGEDE